MKSSLGCGKLSRGAACRYDKLQLVEVSAKLEDAGKLKLIGH